jgi:hypothetical protein
MKRFSDRFVTNFIKIWIVLSILLIISLAASVIVPGLIQLQKQNNYRRCVLVVNMAKKVGGLDTTEDTHEICKYHLK